MNLKLKIFKNIVYAFTAQGISLILSMLMAVIIPKVLGLQDFSYWQLFMFYSAYVGFCHFGLQDGMYLRLGGTNYKEINYSLMGMQLKLQTLIQSLIGIAGIIVGYFYISDMSRLFIWIATIMYMLVYNFCGYIGYIFQSVNQTQKYSISIMIDKTVFIIITVLLVFSGVKKFEIFVILYLFTKLISMMYCIYVGKRIIFSQNCSIATTLKEMWINITVGISLMIANISGSLILGNGRFIIDQVWGIEAFGKFSFSLSLMNFFMMFISQVSMVLFPTLRQLNEDQINKFYLSARNILHLFLPLAFLLYIPMKIIFSIWLPQYRVSLIYLALLLPIVTFDGKMNLLCNTYFKVLRKEKFLLKINTATMLLSFIFNLFGAFILKNIFFIVIFMVISIGVRSIISELYLAKLMKAQVTKMEIQEVILVVIFMICSYNLTSLKAFVVFLIAYFIYIILNFDKLRSIFQHFKFFFRN